MRPLKRVKNFKFIDKSIGVVANSTGGLFYELEVLNVSL